MCLSCDWRLYVMCLSCDWRLYVMCLWCDWRSCPCIWCDCGVFVDVAFVDVVYSQMLWLWCYSQTLWLRCNSLLYVNCRCDHYVFVDVVILVCMLVSLVVVFVDVSVLFLWMFRLFYICWCYGCCLYFDVTAVAFYVWLLYICWCYHFLSVDVVLFLVL